MSNSKPYADRLAYYEALPEMARKTAVYHTAAYHVLARESAALEVRAALYRLFVEPETTAGMLDVLRRVNAMGILESNSTRIPWCDYVRRTCPSVAEVIAWNPAHSREIAVTPHGGGSEFFVNLPKRANDLWREIAGGYYFDINDDDYYMICPSALGSEHGEEPHAECVPFQVEEFVIDGIDLQVFGWCIVSLEHDPDSVQPEHIKLTAAIDEDGDNILSELDEAQVERIKGRLMRKDAKNFASDSVYDHFWGPTGIYS